MGYISHIDRRINGFTLVEMSIVLVIIALVASGVVVGRELVQTSRINASIRDVEKLSTASRAFELKYAALAGDMGKNGLPAVVGRKVLLYWPECATLTSYCELGNNNGIIDQNVEDTNFLYHLYKAQMIPSRGEGVIYANNSESGVFGPWDNNIQQRNRYAASLENTRLRARINTGTRGALVWYTPSPLDLGKLPLTVKEVYMLDLKLDDGVAGTGRMYGAHAADTDAPYVCLSGLQYNLATSADAQACYGIFLFDKF